MAEVYDPKAKKNLETTVNKNGQSLTVGDRVRYTGSSPCFLGDSGKLVKLKREWVSARTLSRAGLYGPPGYSVTALVLWDRPAKHGPHGPASCGPDEIEPTV